MSTYPEPVLRRGRPRGRPPKISQDRVVDAALRRGIDSFTMAELAQDLGVTAQALYTHVRGRDEVVALARASLGARLASLDSSATTWRAWLTDFARAVRRQLGPAAASILAGTHARPSPAALGAGEEGLRLLMAEGLSPAEAGQAVWLVFRTALTSGAEAQAALAGFVDDTQPLVAPGSLEATGAVQAALASDERHDTLDFDLAVVLDGIARRIAAARRRRPQEDRP